MIPGSNLLNMALTVIAKQTVTYLKYANRVLNNVGQDITIYEAPILMTGSFQAVPKNFYSTYGLDFQKTYFNFYAPNNILSLERDVSGDQIVFQGNRYQCESSTDWFGVDGWKGVLCVFIGPQDRYQTLWGFNETPPITDYQNFSNGTFPDEG